MAGNIVSDVDNLVAIRNVIVSVSNKAGLETFVPRLLEVCRDIHFYSTGGTFTALAGILGDKAGSCLTQVSDYTGQPETQGGLVKTLDFKIYLGLLTETHNPSHREDLRRTGAVPIDMAVVNLYPFRETIARKGVRPEEARANIDIGGPCMVRASAKNYLRVASVVDPADYGRVIERLGALGGKLDIATRFALARKAFAHTAEYDATIAAYLAEVSNDDMSACYHFMDAR